MSVDHVQDPQGSVRAAISNAMVAIKKQYYGRGPERAKTYLNDDYVFCAMEGGLTRSEETLIEAGEDLLVRQYRLRFQESISGPVIGAVEEATGRRVLAYHSQIVFNPTRIFEIFLLEPEGG